MSIKERKQSIVIKKGDKGYTYVYSGDKLSKDDLMLEVVGTMDELCSFLGMAKSYKSVVIDSPAGVEHLNRKVTQDINELFIFLDPSIKSIKHIKRVEDITKSVGIHYDHLYIVGNYEFDPGTEDYLRKYSQDYIGKVEYDRELRQYNLSGKSLLELSDDSPACLSVKKILKDTRNIM